MTGTRGTASLAVALLGLLVVGCGAIDPKMAPVEGDPVDFCTAYDRLVGADASTSRDDLEDYLNEFARFGTPRGIPTAARNGFEYLIDPDHRPSDGAELNALPDRTDLVGQDTTALKVYAGQICG